MAKVSLSGAQQAQLVFLGSLPPKFERIHRLIEEIANLHGGETTTKMLTRMLDELKNGASSLSLTSLADIFGNMGQMARRHGGLQVKIRGLREGLVSLKINYEGVLRKASTPEGTPQDEGDATKAGSLPGQSP
jgi:hypothetical protein